MWGRSYCLVAESYQTTSEVGDWDNYLICKGTLWKVGIGECTEDYFAHDK